MQAHSTKASRTCQRCGSEFSIPAAWAKRGEGKYCSRKCKTAANPQVSSVCAFCEKRFSRPKSLSGQYCSRECAYAGRRARVADRFWKQVQKTDSCWIWTASLNKHGYGKAFYEGKTMSAHRLAYILTYGPVSDGINVCHSCDKDYPTNDASYRRCVRPDHLFLGTTADNMKDKAQKGRCNSPAGERNGANLHPDRVARGDNNGQSKVTSEQVLKMFEERKAGKSQKELSAEFGIQISTVSRILNGKRWKHIGHSSTSINSASVNSSGLLTGISPV